MRLGANRVACMGRRSRALRPTAATVRLTAPEPTIQATNVLASIPPADVRITAPDPSLGLPIVVQPTAALVALTAPNPTVRLSTLAPPVSEIILTAPNPTVTVAPPSVTWPNGYIAYRDIVIPAGAVSAALSDFSMLLEEIENALRHIDEGGRVFSEAGGDIRFESVTGVTATTGTKLDHRLAAYGAEAGEAVAIIEVTTLASSSRTFLRIYYGKPATNEEDTAGLYSNARAAWDCGSGFDYSPSALHLSAPSSGSSGFVQVATPYWTTLDPSNIVAPGSWDEEDENTFNPGAGKAVDLRDREGRNHISGQQGRVTLVQLTAAAGAGVFGFKCRGMQTRGDTHPVAGPTAPLPWQAMKFGSHGVYQTGSLASDGSWDDKHVKINGSINGTVYVEDFASYDAMDGIDTGDVGNEAYKLVMNRFYARGARDDFIQNDQLKEIECNDFLIDGTHFLCSVRPGGTLTSTKNLTFRNGLIRLRRQRYYGDWGGGGTPSWNQKALYTAPWDAPTDTGTPSLPNGADGYGHNQLIKDSAGFQGLVTMTRCLILMESRPLGGPNELIWPDGTYTDVVVLYMGETTNLGPTPPGVTIRTDVTENWNSWQTERSAWLTAHGNTDGTGDDFSYLHA